MRANKESRRKFLKTSLKTAAGLGVLSIGGVYLAPNRANATNQIQLKEQKMWDTKRIIAYLLQIYEFLEKYLINLEMPY